MAIAKNFSQCGIWGLTKSGFTSSDSSILWPLILSLIYLLFGHNEIYTFILNVLLASLMVVMYFILLSNENISPFYVLITLIALIFFPSLPANVFSGMEHILQTIIAILFVYFSAAELDSDISYSYNKKLILLSILVTSIRYEGVFLVLAVCFLLALRKKYKCCLLIGLSGFLPILSYGLVSLIHGWYFLPNSVLLKGNLPPFQSPLKWIAFLFHRFSDIGNNNYIYNLLLAALFLIIYDFGNNKLSKYFYINAIFVITLLLHMIFASIGGFYRYEAYLIALGFLSISLSLFKDFSLKKDENPIKNSMVPLKYGAILIIIFYIFIPYCERAADSLLQTPVATNNIYQQQYQMARFLRKYYEKKNIAANDVGAINYLSDINCLDLWGLANFEVARLKRKNNYNREKIYSLAQSSDIQVAILYDHWFKDYGGIPPQWIKVSQWKIKNNIVCGGDTVSFYAATHLERNRLEMSLREFASELPPSIEISFFNP